MSDAKKPEAKKEDRFAIKNIDEVLEKLKKEKAAMLASVAKKEKIFGEFDTVDAESKRLELTLKGEYDAFIKILKRSRVANTVYHVSLFEEIFDLEKTRLADFKA